VSKFITFEGIDGVGKTTQLNLLIERLAVECGVTVHTTREPGGTPLGETLRSLVLGHSLDSVSELLLMFAARREHVVQRIEPHLQKGEWVVSDRFSDASLAYQVGGRGLKREWVNTLMEWVHPNTYPDATFILDLNEEIAWQRRQQRSKATQQTTTDTFEKQNQEFYSRVRQMYLQLARDYANRVHIIDANRSIEAIHEHIWSITAGLS